MTSESLDPRCLHALLDILSHREVYAEIEDFKTPGILDNYGSPFTTQSAPSGSPALQALVSKFCLVLPGLKDVDDAFWTQRVVGLIQAFQEADLSESYDKGNIGIRKTLATAISALLEYPVRGVFAGFNEPSEEDLRRQYDTSKAEDLQCAFRDFMHQMVYGDMIDQMFKRVGETPKLSEHPQLVQAAHEYILVNLASFLHYTLIISPKGQNLLALIDSANKLVPYTVMKQTLRIGNVASMINGMMKVVLAKMSMGSVTNWIGWTSGADEGMNLLQHIISQVLQWDIRDLKSRASKIEKEKQSSKEQLEALRNYATKSRKDHQRIREQSKANSKSIVSEILDDAHVSAKFDEQQHRTAQDYVASQLAIRDRDQIIKVLCHTNPDHLTQSVRDLVQAYDPLIRQTHNAVDLSATLGDFEVFLKDLIKLAKLSENRGRTSHKAQDAPTVGDFVQLLKKHQSSSHRFLHQVINNGPEISSWFRDYMLQITSNFRRKDTSGSNPSSTMNDEQVNAGDLTSSLNELFQTVDESKRPQYLKILNKHEQYLNTLHKASARRLRLVLKSPPSKHYIFQNKSGMFGVSSSQPGSRSTSPDHAPATSTSGLDANPGPGAFLARWQALIDNSEITSLSDDAKIRKGGQGSVLKASRIGPDPSASTDGSADSRMSSAPGNGGDSEDEDVFEEAHEQLDQFGLEDKEKMRPPDVSEIVKALLPGFRDILKKRGSHS